MRVLITAVVCIAMLLLAGCKVDSITNRLLIDAVDEERVWWSNADPRIPGIFTMPISYNPIPPQIGEERDLTVHLRYGDSVPFTEFMMLRIEGGIDLIGEEGVDFFRYTAADKERVMGSTYFPEFRGGPDYYFKIPPSRILVVQFRVTGNPDNEWYRLDFVVTFTREDTPKTRFATGTDITYFPASVGPTTNRWHAQCHPSQWDLFTEEYLASLDFKPIDPAIVPPKTRYYNVNWNQALAAALQDDALRWFYNDLSREIFGEILPSGKKFYEEHGGYVESAALATFAHLTFPNDYPSQEILELIPYAVSIEGGWPE